MGGSGFIPTCPTIVKPVGSSSCSSTGRMAVIISSGGNQDIMGVYLRYFNVHTIVPVVVGQLQIVISNIDLLLLD